jgi:hypothetical protein
MAGLTIEATAEALGLTTGQVAYAQQVLGFRKPKKGPSRKRYGWLSDVVESNGLITIEQGLNGGYIVTLGDQWTGEERCSIKGAIKSAETAAREGS